MSAMLADATQHMVDLEDEDGRAYQGRITGKLVWEDPRREIQMFVTDDERVLLYVATAMAGRQIDEIEDPETIREWGQETYVAVMHALGEKPIVDL